MFQGIESKWIYLFLQDIFYRQNSESGMGEEILSTGSRTNHSSSFDLLEYGLSPGFKHT